MTDSNPKNLDESRISMIGHISIRDPDTGEVMLRQRDQNEAMSYEAAIKKIEPYLHEAPDGTFTLTTTAEETGIDPIIFDHLSRSLEQTNVHVRAGLYRVGDSWEFDIKEQPDD